VRFVLLALLDRDVRRRQIVERLEALHALRDEVAVRHRVTNHDDPLALLFQRLGDRTRGLALA
jgi:hypothetical protein